MTRLAVVDICAELLELDRADERHDQAEQQRDDGDDRQGLHAALLRIEQKVGAAEAGASAQEPPKSKHDLTEKIERARSALGETKRPAADGGNEREMRRCARRVFALRHGRRERDQAPQAVRQPAQIDGRTGLAAKGKKLQNKSDERAVPGRDMGRIEG